MFFTFNNKQVYYELHGQGTPLLILNGIMMSTNSWQQFLDQLTPFHQVILVDFLDQGQSDKLDDGYDHQIQVDLVGALIDHLDLGKVNVYGVSYGGQIALQVCLQYPDKIDKVLISNASADTTYWLREIGHAWNKAAVDPEAYYLTTIPVIYSPQFFNEQKEWMENRKKILLDVFSQKPFIESMIRLTKSSENYDISDQVHNIKHKMLIVGSEYDLLTPFYQQEYLHKQIENSDLVKVPGAGHALMYEKPHLFMSLLLGFMNA